MVSLPVLLPNPKNLTFQDGHCELDRIQFITLRCQKPQSLLFTAYRLKLLLRKKLALNWELAVADNAKTDEGIVLAIDRDTTTSDQGYRITIAEGHVSVCGKTAIGVAYGVATFMQLCQQYGKRIPNLMIEDWPDFPNRGIMIDVSRDKVPTMETLFELVDLFASWKINQLQLYTEHTFAYQNHQPVWAEASPMTGEEILLLDAYCRERFIELVPNQNCFGHMNRWLKHEEYRHLAETHDGFNLMDVISRNPETLCPTDSNSIEFVSGIFDELLPYFSSSHFNVNLDETFELGLGRSKSEVEQKGKGRVFLEYLLKIHELVSNQGKTMMYWGDMIVGYPNLLSDLPKDGIVLEWGYEALHPFKRRCSLLSENQISFYVCPGTSSWNSISGRTNNALKNIATAAENGHKFGAKGLLNTDWGDHGHWQPLSVSFPGFIYGAAVSWGIEENRTIDLGTVVDCYGFDTKTRGMGQLICDLGNIYEDLEAFAINSTVLFHLLQNPISRSVELYQKGDTGFSVEDILKFVAAEEEKQGHGNMGELDKFPIDVIQQALRGEFFKLKEENLFKVFHKINGFVSSLNEVETEERSVSLAKDELLFVCKLLAHACKRGHLVLRQAANENDEKLESSLIRELDELISEHKRIWLLRNRPGGLKDSVSRMERLKEDYSVKKSILSKWMNRS